MAPTLDRDGDGVVTEQELENAKQEALIEKLDAQKNIAWLAALSMPIYALLPAILPISAMKLDTMAAMSDMLFLSQASIVGLFFGAQAYMAKK